MNKKSFIITVIIFIAVLIFAVLGYNYLSQNVMPDNGKVDLSKTPARNFTVYDAAGNKVSLSDFKGKPVVVNLWATWCGPCKAEMPYFDELAKEYGNEVEFLMVNVDESDVSDFLTQNGYSFPVYYDLKGSASQVYRASSIPRTVFVDKDGFEIGLHIGQISKSALENYINKLIGE